MFFSSFNFATWRHTRKRGRAISLLTAAAFAVTLSPAALSAQVDAGRVNGTVTDPTGAVLPNATVTLHNVDTGIDHTVTSNGQGTYQFNAVPAGNYVETVTTSGFGTYKQSLVVTVGVAATVDVKLVTASASTVVEVQGGDTATAVNTTNAEISQVIDNAQIVALPSLTRNPYDFVALSGNATSDPGGSTSRGVGVSLTGQRSAGTEILLDGVENEDNYDATAGQQIPLDSVSEYRVITNGFDAQYGRASGGIVNLITRGGTNSFHGSVYAFNRVSALAANTWNEDAQNFLNRQSGLPNNPADHFTRNQFGYAVGGPVFKDKLFFFSNTEWIRIRSAGQQQFEIPTASFLASSNAATQAYFNAYGKVDSTTRLGALIPVTGFASAPLQVATKVASIDAGAGTPQNAWETLNRIDYTLNDKISMYFRAANYAELDFPGTNSLSPYAGFDTGTTIFNQSYLYNLNYAITNNLLSNSKVSFSRQNNSQPLNGPAVPTLYLNQANTTSTDPNTGNAIVFPGYLPTSPGNALPFGGPANVYQFQENLTWTKGRHTLTFGGEFLQLRDNRTFGAYEGAVELVAKTGTNYATALNTLQNGGLYSFEVAINPQGKLPCSYNLAGTLVATPACSLNLPASSPNFERENTFNDGSWYAQDSYKFNQYLTATLGLRWDYYGVQHNHDPNLESNFFLGTGSNLIQQIASGQVATTPNSPVGGLIAKNFKNYAPRVGLAWDVFGDGKWSVRGGAGLSYERNFGNVTYNVIQNPPNYAGVTLTKVDANGNPLTVQTNNFGPFAGTSGTVPLAQPSLRALQQNMPTAYTEQWNLAIEHQLTPNDLIAVEYSGAHGVHQYAIAGYNGIGYGTFNGSTDPNAYRLNRINHQYGGINQRIANGSSKYQGLNIRYETHNLKRYGLEMSVNYTLSHALDNLSSTFSESGNNFNLGYLNPFNPGLDWGNADYDVRHRVTIGGIYEPTFLEFRGNRVLHTALGGLQFAPIAVLRTGTPFTIYDCTNGMNSCPRIVPAAGLKYHGTVGADNGANSFDYLAIPAASANPFVNAQGDSDFPDTLGGFQNAGIGRNQWYGPNNVSFNLGAYKNFKFGPEDRFAVQLRAEFYDVLNNHNFYPVVSTADIAEVSNVNVEKGVIGGGSPSSHDERRNTQLAIRLQF